MFWNRKSGHFPVLERPFPVFCVLLGKWFCPGTSRDRGVCPGTFAPGLVPGQRDTGTRFFFCPGTKGQRDVPSRFVPGRPVPWKPYLKRSLVKVSWLQHYNNLNFSLSSCEYKFTFLYWHLRSIVNSDQFLATLNLAKLRLPTILYICAKSVMWNDILASWGHSTKMI